MKQHSFSTSLLALAASAFLLSACTPQVESRGHIKDDTAEASIKAGETSRMEVLRLMGSPSSQSSFGEEVWYYISTTKEQTAFFKPKVASQSVVAIYFDKDGKVSKLDEYKTEDGKRVEFAKDATPTGGESVGVVGQLLGNLGRFNNGKQIDTMR